MNYKQAIQIHDVSFLTKEIIPNSGEIFYGNDLFDIVCGMTIHNPFTASKSKRMYAKQTLREIGLEANDLPKNERDACVLFMTRLLRAGYASWVIKDGEVQPPWKLDNAGIPFIKIRKKKVVAVVSQKYHETAQRNIAKSHEARRNNPELAHAIAVKASAAALAKSTPEEIKRRCAKARAAKLLKSYNMTPEEKAEAHKRRSEAAKRAHETRRRNAELRAAAGTKA